MNGGETLKEELNGVKTQIKGKGGQVLNLPTKDKPYLFAGRPEYDVSEGDQDSPQRILLDVSKWTRAAVYEVVDAFMHLAIARRSSRAEFVLPGKSQYEKLELYSLEPLAIADLKEYIRRQGLVSGKCSLWSRWRRPKM